MELDDAGIVRIPPRRKGDGEDGERGRTELFERCGESPEALQRDRGGHEQQHGNRHLTRNKQPPQPARAPDNRAAGAVRRGRRGHRCRAQAGRDAERSPRRGRDENGHDHRRSIHGDRVPAGDPLRDVGGHCGADQTDQPEGDRRRERARHAGGHDRFRQDQREHMTAAATERGPDGELVTPLDRASDEQVRHVGDAEAQHERRRSLKQQEQRRGELVLLAAQQLKIEAASAVRVRVSQREIAGDARQVGRGNGRGRAGLDPPDTGQALDGPLFALLSRQHERHPRVDAGGIGLFVRNDADNSRGPAVDRQLATDDVRIGAEMRLPEPPAEQHDGVGAGPVLVRGEASSEQRPDAEQVEEVGGDRRALHGFRLAWSADDDRHGTVAGHPAERLRFAPEVEIVARCNRTPLMDAVERPAVADEDELVDGRKRIGPAEQRAQKARRRDVERQADRQHRDRKQRQGRSLDQSPDGVPQVIHACEDADCAGPVP